MPRKARPPIDRFNEKWTEDADGCHIWTERLTPKGYGEFAPMDGGSSRAHRWLFGYIHGFLPETVMHHCDKRACVRISCLMPGTPRGNTDDMIKKGRMKVGNDLPQTVLTESQVRQIKARYKRHDRNGNSGKDLAAEFGVHVMTISDIIRGATWAWV